FLESVRDLDPSETLFIVCSQSSAAVETIANAYSARAWLIPGLGGDESSVSKHFVAVSANADAAVRLGIDASNTFAQWDWVGEHYCLASAVGLSTMLAIGPEHFRDLLSGFHQMDTHFLSAPPERNIPVLIASLTIWYVNFFGAETVAVLPYEQYLSRF